MNTEHDSQAETVECMCCHLHVHPSVAYYDPIPQAYVCDDCVERYT